jgi:hypothetical protein
MLVAAFALPAAGSAQSTPASESAGALAAPAAGVAARPDAISEISAGQHRLYVTSDARHDTARVERLHAPESTAHEWRCDTPCALTLSPGDYRIWMSAVALDEAFSVGTSDVFAEGRPAHLIELGLGIGVGVVGIALISIALLTGEGACFDFGESCPASRGPLALGAGAFALAVGVGLMIDSSGFIEITSVRP